MTNSVLSTEVGGTGNESFGLSSTVNQTYVFKFPNVSRCPFLYYGSSFVFFIPNFFIPKSIRVCREVILRSLVLPQVTITL